MVEDVEGVHGHRQIVTVLRRGVETATESPSVTITAARSRATGRSFELSRAEAPRFTYAQVDTNESRSLADVAFNKWLSGYGERVEKTVVGIGNVWTGSSDHAGTGGWLRLTG